MTKQHSFAVTLFPPLATAAALHTALMLVAFRQAPIADHFGLGIWWLFLTVYQAVMTKYLQSPRELRSIVLLSAEFVIGQLFVTIRCAPIYPTFTGWFAALAMWIATYYHCVNGLLDGMKPESIMVIFETTAMTLLFSAAIAGSGAIHSGVLLHLGISLFLILIAMMRHRTLHTRIDTESPKSAANLLPPLILLAVAVFVVLVCILISGSAAQILTQITAWLSHLLQTAVNLLGAFLFWLLSLLPDPDTTLGEDAFYAEALPAGQQEQVSVNNGIILYLLIFAVIGALVFCVLKLWRKIHLQGRSPRSRSVRAAVVKKSSLWDSIKLFFGRLRQRVLFELQYLRCRNTGPGLLVWLERQMRRKRMKRKQGETTSAFLNRVGMAFPLCQDDLCEWSGQLDRYYFGAGDDLAPETVRSLRKKLKRAFSVKNESHEKKSHS